MFYGFERNVIAAGGFVLEKTLSEHVLPAARSFPVILIFILVSHPSKEVPAEKIVKKVRFIAVYVILNELIRQSVNEQASDAHRPIVFPCAHHATKWNQIAVASRVPFLNRRHFRSWIGCFPTPAAVCIGKRVCSCSVQECRYNLEGNTIRKRHKDNLAVSSNACGGISLRDGCPNRLQKRGLAVSEITIVSVPQRCRQFE